MAKKQTLVCENCKQSSEVKVKHSALGFPTMKCPKCQHFNTYPLSNSYRNGYIGMIVIGVLILIWGLTAGQPVVPGILFIAACIALYSDNKKRKALNATAAVPESQTIGTSKATSYCSQCGAGLKSDASFCQNCGNKTLKPAN